MKSQALGRGLGALLSEIDEAYDNELPKKDSIIEISLKDIRPNPFQPRKSFDDESLAELSESIKHNGLLQPIVVKEDVDGYILIAGERRFRASKLAKFKTIRAIVMNSDDEKMRQLALIENIQRDELNAIELAFAYNELLKLHEITHDELSQMIHKSRTHITNTIRLLQLSQKTQKALLENKITAGHAKVLIGLDEKEQQLMVDSIIGQKLSVRDVEAMIKSMKEECRPSMKEKTASGYDFSSMKQRFATLGYKAKFSQNRCTIEFDDEAQIESFLSLLQK
jgi:ParB family chromosome partitioning protein